MNAPIISRKAVLTAIALFMVMTGCGGNMPPLSTAARDGNIDWVKALVDEKKADVNARGDYNYTALHWAAYQGYAPVAQALLDRGAQVDPREDGGATPLLLAAQRGYADVCAILIAKGADLNAKDKNANWTPLMYAVKIGNIEVVKELVGAGADVNYVNLKTGDSAMSIARSYSRNDITDFLSGKDQQKSGPPPAGVETVRGATDPKYPSAKPTDDTLVPKKVNAVPAD